MKYLYVILTFLITSCLTTKSNFSYDPSYQSVNTTYYTNPRPFWGWLRPSYLYQPNYFYNPYFVPNYYIAPRYIPPTRPRTNLPLNTNSGTRGGRRR